VVLGVDGELSLTRGGVLVPYKRAMDMLARLKYLVAEGFEISMISAPDHWEDVHRTGEARITYVEPRLDGTRRVRSQDFEVTPEEWRRCARLFLRAKPQGNPPTHQ
jgi:hypothetical protein